MAKKMDLFYILKLNLSTIIENKNNINTSFSEAKKNGWVISISDNQVLKFIRDINGVNFNDNKKILEDLYTKRNLLKSEPSSLSNSKSIEEYQKQIDNLLYLPDVISVHADTNKKDYKKVSNDMFNVNGITYKRLCAGAGQLRRNTALFVNNELYNKLEEIMLCGLTKKRIGNINLAKFSAYYSLYSSSTNIITTPRVCVVKDYEMILKDQKVDWIYEENGERKIETRIIDINQNVWDGSGLVDIDFAKKWNNDLGIKDYSPSAYIIRSAWIKGLCVCFDWKRFARNVAKNEYLIDVWGKKHHIDNIDVILTTSQFKMWKKYDKEDGWNEYLTYHKKYGHVWGCSRVNKKQDNYMTPLNYQYIQSNFFTTESIKRLADLSIDYVKKVLSGERIYVLLYLLGCFEKEADINEIEKQTGMSIVKALMYDSNILNDKYIRERIYKSIEKKINQIKIGKPLVEGSYEFAIVDPYMFCEYVFGNNNPQGLLKLGQIWQKRWVDKGVKEIAVMRSPLVSPNENNILNVYSDNNCEDWYSSISSGVILNGWDTSLMRASDADTDGDLLLTTDNEYFIDAVNRNLNPITYEKSNVKEQTLTYSNLVKMDTKSFNTKIGFITNLATSFICLREQYDKNSPEYKELTKRINLLRFHQGSAIDAGKGNLYVAPPKEWSKSIKINYKDDSEEILQSKYFNNKLVGNKKSYFMCYIYPSLMKEYKQHKDTSMKICRFMFNCKIEDLFNKKEKTQDEKMFIKNYYKYLPVLTNKSIMNQLCWYIEGIDFNLKFFKGKTEFDYNILMNPDLKVDKTSLMYENILKIINKYYNMYVLRSHEMKVISEDYDCSYIRDEESEDNEFKIFFNELINELYNICSNRFDLCNYMVYIMYEEFKNKSKSLLWNVCGNEIVENLKLKNKIAYFPIETKNKNDYEFLNRYYKLQEVDIIDNI